METFVGKEERGDTTTLASRTFDIDVHSFLLKQKLHHLYFSFGAAMMQCSSPIIIALIHVQSSKLKQGFCFFDVAGTGSLNKASDSCGGIAKLGTLFAQVLNHRQVFVSVCIVERRPAPTIGAVDPSSFGHEETTNIDMAFRCGQVLRTEAQDM